MTIFQIVKSSAPVAAACLAAGVSVWGAYISQRNLDIVEEQAARSAVVPLQLSTTEKCELSVSPVPEGVQFNYLLVRAGKDDWESPEVNQVGEKTDLVPLLNRVFDPIKQRILDQPEVKEHLRDKVLAAVDWGDSIWTKVTPSAEYDVLVPVAVIYSIDVRGQHQRHYDLMGLRVRYEPFAEWDTNKPHPKISPDQPTCHGLTTFQSYSNKESLADDADIRWRQFNQSLSGRPEGSYDSVPPE